MKDKTTLEEIMANMTSMAQQRRFEAQQDEIKKARETKAKNLDAQDEGSNDGRSSDEA